MTSLRSFVLLLSLCVLGLAGCLSKTERLPLSVSADRRHLVDASGKPYLVVGDTAWSLIAQARPDEVALYLDDRKQRGFNAIIVNLLEHMFATNAPATIADVQPFLQPGDFTQPNPAYFDHAHDVIAAAAERGIAVWLCPAYLGTGGGPEGFYREIKAAGPAALRAYGRYVGARFKDLPNIVWMAGGDYDKPELWTAAELIAGIREGGAMQLATAHGGSNDATDAFGDQPWLELDNVYRYVRDLYRPLRAGYARRPVRPFVLIETYYEGEHKTPPEQVRRQAWWAMLSGACGQFFGNSPIYHLGGPGQLEMQTAPGNSDWRKALNSPGSRDAARVGAFFRGQPWSELVPDVDDTLVTDGRGEDVTFVTVAVTADNRRAIVYVPSDGIQPRTLTLDLARFSTPLRAEWFNPARDGPVRRLDAPLPNSAGVQLNTPGDNGTGTNDWVLVLSAL